MYCVFAKSIFTSTTLQDCIGECGAAIGPAMLVVALAACRKGYGEGANIFCHLGNDAGERAAMLLSYQTVRVN